LTKAQKFCKDTNWSGKIDKGNGPGEKNGGGKGIRVEVEESINWQGWKRLLHNNHPDHGVGWGVSDGDE